MVGTPEYGCVDTCQVAVHQRPLSATLDGYDAINTAEAEEESRRYEVDYQRDRHKIVPEMVGLASNPRPRPVVPEDWMLVAHPFVPGPDGCDQVITEGKAVIGEDLTVTVDMICGRRPSHAVHQR